jgi:hypothetical protein
MVARSRHRGGREGDESGVETASQHALEFCRRHPRWQRFCDIQDTDALAITWEELPHRVRTTWETRYPYSAEVVWREFGQHPMRHRFGYVDASGEFYDSILHVKLNIMTVVETGGPEGVYFNGGRKEKSARTRKPAKAKTT